MRVRVVVRHQLAAQIVKKYAQRPWNIDNEGKNVQPLFGRNLTRATVDTDTHASLC